MMTGWATTVPFKHCVVAEGRTERRERMLAVVSHEDGAGEGDVDVLEEQTGLFLVIKVSKFASVFGTSHQTSYPLSEFTLACQCFAAKQRANVKHLAALTH